MQVDHVDVAAAHAFHLADLAGEVSDHEPVEVGEPNFPVVLVLHKGALVAGDERLNLNGPVPTGCLKSKPTGTTKKWYEARMSFRMENGV